jgi:mono/diheme cytochrome c family protein
MRTSSPDRGPSAPAHAPARGARTRRLQAASAALLAIAATHGPAGAADAQRGAALYAALPGNAMLGSCASCHGDPLNNRNSVLRGAVGGEWIARTIVAVGAMGYLRQALTEADLADISAYLATVAPAADLAQLPAPWPTAVDFGTVLAGTDSPTHEVSIRSPRPTGDVGLGALGVSDPAQFVLTHDCPLALPPQGQCRARVAFRPAGPGPAGATLRITDASGNVLRSATLAGHGALAHPARLRWAVSASLADFGAVPLGQSARRTLDLVNDGPVDLPLERLRAGGPNAARFALGGECIALARVPATGRCALEIDFSPTLAERAEGTVEIAAAATHPPTMRLLGLGVVPAGAVPAAPTPPPAEAAPPSGPGGGATGPAWLLLLAAAVRAVRSGARCPHGGDASCRRAAATSRSSDGSGRPARSGSRPAAAGNACRRPTPCSPRPDTNWA